ncbi:DUF6221 family protein [Streptomyces globisporus]|uniref:DUF6221 family protein n=1 Tax=Streptomyces globisporus TaxID=1908 RepID=UPI00382347D3
MTDLADFLRVRIAERRAIANTIHDLGCGEIRYDGTCTCGQPVLILADLDAKLAIVDEHEPGGRYWPDSSRQYCKTCGSGEPDEYPTDWPCRTLRILARPFAGHPDYQEDWAA